MPILIISLVVNNMVLVVPWEEDKYKIIEVNINADLVAWIRKYLIDDSVSKDILDMVIKGIIDIRFISNASHIIIQLVDVSIIRLEVNRVMSSKMILGETWVIIMWYIFIC